MITLFTDSKEYEARRQTPFVAPELKISDIHSAVPKHLHLRSTIKSLFFVLRDVLLAFVLYLAAARIDHLQFPVGLPIAASFIRAVLWATYWTIQGMVLGGWWVLGHEAGHSSLSPYGFVNDTVGYLLHTFLLVPYFSWRSTHNMHHRGSSSLERDGTYVPRTRSYYGLPPEKVAHVTNYHDVFEETPIYTLCQMLVMQLLGWQTYLLTNAMGDPKLPAWTNHFDPASPLFKPQHRTGVIASNIGLGVMASILWLHFRHTGLSAFIKLYLVPYLLANHWVVMMTFLHHSDPTIPHYRNKGWTYVRGALATVDRPILGWAGRFFFHNVSHDHIAHHFFTTIPFYNLPQVTQCIRPVLGGHYNFDSTNCFRALYRSFTQCRFIEDEGDIVFYKNKDGVAVRQLAHEK